MEAYFGADFSAIRVHDGPEAASIGALAFTHGADLYFAPGHYHPTTPQGQRLLGHELTHVVQQRAGRVRNPLGPGVAVVQDPALEAEAERMGQGAAASRDPVRPGLLQAKKAPPVASIPGRVVQRVKIVDMETGEELQPLTIEDLARGLPLNVQRALMTLPPIVRQWLAGLPLAAQRGLLELSPAAQLLIIDWLGRLAQPRRPDRAAHGGGLVPLGGAWTPPPVGRAGGLPPELVDFLLGRGQFPAFFGGIVVDLPMGAPRHSPRLLGPPRLNIPQRLVLRPPVRPIEVLPIGDVERMVYSIDAYGRPPHRSREDVVRMATGFSRMSAEELHLVLQLPPARSLTNLRYLIHSKPAHCTIPFVVGLARDYPKLSVYSISQLAELPPARVPDIPRLVAGRPGVITIEGLVDLASGLPARDVEDVLVLAELYPQRTVPQIIVIGGAGGHRSGDELAELARRLPALSSAEIVALANIAARPLNALLVLGSAVNPVRTAAILATLATSLPNTPVQRLVLIANLPGCTALPLPQLRAISVALNRHGDLLGTAANAHAALGTLHINHLADLLRDVINARDPLTYANLMVILQWAHFADHQNMVRIVGHAKVDTMARLLSWLNNPNVDDGNRLYAVLQNGKVEGAADVDYLLGTLLAPRYTLTQLASWLGQPWATRGAGANKTFVNGRVPLANVTGSGNTAGQRYSPDYNSGAWLGHIYHLSMSFSIQGHFAVYTGFHVSWRLPGQPDRTTDPRLFFTINAGRVAVGNQAGAFPGPALVNNAMDVEAEQLMRLYLPRVNCYM
jgi:hypothetical protein